MGVEIDDKEMAMAVLNGLTERFNNLISAWTHLEKRMKHFLSSLL